MELRHEASESEQNQLQRLHFLRRAWLADILAARVPARYNASRVASTVAASLNSRKTSPCGPPSIRASMDALVLVAPYLQATGPEQGRRL